MPKYKTAAAQFVYASMLNSEAAWKSIPEYFPDDKTYTRQAREHLALWYLQTYDYEAALKIFHEFSGANEIEKQSQAFGLAGEAIALNRQGKSAESAEKLAELWPLRNQLTGEMSSLLRMFLQSNRQAALMGQSRGRWQSWLNDSAPEQPPRPASPAAKSP